MSRTVPLRLEDRDLRQVDFLVSLGIYKSRSEALRELIRLGVKSLKGIFEVGEAVMKLEKLEKKEGDVPIKLKGALEQLLEERERFK
ncbi:MAG: CopG family transcriptional regulator [Thermoproteota archaeon]|nr:MAG: CopG family transcriptional regulator [Candidatus Korarchaeota archaeon]